MRLGAAFALVCLPAAFAQGQLPAADPPVADPPAEATSVITTHSTLVVVPALVRTKGGQLVFTLKASDFVLTDDGVAQKVTLEQDTGGEPLALVVVLETGGDGARQVERYRTFSPMLDSLVGDVDHRVAVVSFDSEPALVQDFTTDMDAVGHAIHELEPGNPGSAILDGLGFALELLRQQPLNYRRMVLLVSETIDHGSKLSMKDALHTISDTNTSVYSFGFSSSRGELKHESMRAISSDPNPGPAGGCMAKDHADDPETSNNRFEQFWDCLSLLAPPLRIAKAAAIAATNQLRSNVPETVAHLTGGEYFKLGSAKEIESSIHTVSNHLPNRYILTFHPQAPHPGPHALELRVPDYAHLDVDARTSYWANGDGTGAPAR